MNLGHPRNLAAALTMSLLFAPAAGAQSAPEEPALAAEPDVGAGPAAARELDAFVSSKARRRILRVAVYDLSVSGVEPRVASIVNEFLLVELRKLERVSVIGYSEIRTLLDLEADRQAAGCDSEDSCLAEVADALGTDILITGTLAAVGKDHVFGLKILDQGQAKAGRSFNKIMQAEDGTEFLSQIGPAVEALFPGISLKAGLERGVSENAVRRLRPPPIPQWAFWSGVGVSSVALVGSLVAGGVRLAFYSQYVDTVKRSQEGLVDGGQLVGLGNISVASEVIGWSLLGAGLVIGSATALLIPLTDFEGGAE